MFTHFTRTPVFWEERGWVISICTRSSLWLLLNGLSGDPSSCALLGKQEKKKKDLHRCQCKEPACQQRKHKSCGFNPWIGKIPWRRARQPTPVFLPGESPWTEEPGGRQHMGSQRVWHNWLTKHRAQQRVKSRLRREKHRKILVLKGNVYCSFSPLEGPCHIGNLDEKRASCKLTTALS